MGAIFNVLASGSLLQFEVFCVAILFISIQQAKLCLLDVLKTKLKIIDMNMVSRRFDPVRRFEVG